MSVIDQNVLISLCPDPIIGIDSQGVVIVFNPAAEKVLGYVSASVVGQLHIMDLYEDLDQARSIKKLLFSSSAGGSGQVEGIETCLRHVSGSLVPIRLSASVWTLPDGSQGSIGFFHDLTARKSLEAKLHQQAITDELTGLYNQRHFFKTLCFEMDRAAQKVVPLSLLCIDLDNLKLINDRFGHLAGDQALATAGKALRRSIRTGDLLFRYGGDEFMVILPDISIEEAGRISERVRSTYNRLCATPVQVGPSLMKASSLSIGATYTDGTEPSEEVVRRADMAMYRSKKFGGNRSSLLAMDLEFVRA